MLLFKNSRILRIWTCSLSWTWDKYNWWRIWRMISFWFFSHLLFCKLSEKVYFVLVLKGNWNKRLADGIILWTWSWSALFFNQFLISLLRAFAWFNVYPVEQFSSLLYKCFQFRPSFTCLVQKCFMLIAWRIYKKLFEVRESLSNLFDSFLWFIIIFILHVFSSHFVNHFLNLAGKLSGRKVWFIGAVVIRS